MSDFTPRLIDIDKAIDALDAAFLDHYTLDRQVTLSNVKRVLIEAQLKEESVMFKTELGSSLGKNKTSLLTTKPTKKSNVSPGYYQ